MQFRLEDSRIFSMIMLSRRNSAEPSEAKVAWMARWFVSCARTSLVTIVTGGTSNCMHKSTVKPCASLSVRQNA
jgi:hypothetical protein